VFLHSAPKARYCTISTAFYSDTAVGCFRVQKIVGFYLFFRTVFMGTKKVCHVYGFLFVPEYVLLAICGKYGEAHCG